MALDKKIVASRDRTRRLVLLSVWVVVLLGLPLWWKTTRVYRAELPYDDIEHWKEWKTCQPKFPISFNLHLSEQASASELGAAAILKAITSAGTPVAESSNVLSEQYNIDLSWKGSKEQDITEHIAKSVVETLDAIFGSEKKTLKQLMNGSHEQGAEKVTDQLKAVKYAPGYQLTFSLFSGDAANGVREWQAQEAINAYLAPFLKSMETISKFTVESQIQHYASLTFTPQVDTDLKEHYLTMDALPHFINAAEWSLASTVSSLPSLNFLTYIPKPSESPLVIKAGPSSPRSTTNSFLIPRWGGITILNRDNSTATAHPNVITVQELEPVMKLYLTQLRDLMGLSHLSSSASFPITFHRSANGAPTAWELDQLMRKRTAENMVDSLATLLSLANLVADTPNMVVLDHIQKDVVDALQDVATSCHSLAEQKSVLALEASRDALVKAETAFFDPTMVSMLYFPDEHKYAIYMPLFVPISVPLVMALLREIKKWKDAKKAAAKEATKEKAE
ncbi:GPI transamidase component [Mortierella alpina]|nr:GPI transamidase component [Mortierella alpina]